MNLEVKELYTKMSQFLGESRGWHQECVLYGMYKVIYGVSKVVSFRLNMKLHWKLKHVKCLCHVHYLVCKKIYIWLLNLIVLLGFTTLILLDTCY